MSSSRPQNLATAIDTLVYALYALTPEEIRLVEEATAPQKAAEATEPDDAPASSAPKPAEYHAQAEADAAHAYFAKEDPPTPA